VRLSTGAMMSVMSPDMIQQPWDAQPDPDSDCSPESRKPPPIALGWQQFRDHDGRMYFHNPVFGKTTWDRREAVATRISTNVGAGLAKHCSDVRVSAPSVDQLFCASTAQDALSPPPRLPWPRGALEQAVHAARGLAKPSQGCCVLDRRLVSEQRTGAGETLVFRVTLKQQQCETTDNVSEDVAKLIRQINVDLECEETWEVDFARRRAQVTTKNVQLKWLVAAQEQTVLQEKEGEPHLAMESHVRITPTLTLPAAPSRVLADRLKHYTQCRKKALLAVMQGH